MYRKFISSETEGISKKIKNEFSEVVRSMEIELRQKSRSAPVKLERLEVEIRGLSQKVNRFSNLLLNDNFSFRHFDAEPLLVLKYTEVLLQHLIQNHAQDKNMPSGLTQKGYNESNIYELMASLKLENHDLKDKIEQMGQAIKLSNERAKSSEAIAEAVKQKSEKMLDSYKENFVVICDLLKRSETNEIELVQGNRLLKEELQSLSIQFERYKQYFKQGPSIKEKQSKIKEKLEKDYEQRLKNIIKQVEYRMQRQLDLQIAEHGKKSPRAKLNLPKEVVEKK